MLRRQSTISQMYPAPPFVTDVPEAGGRRQRKAQGE
eukprot:ctg_5134.g639